ncbi:glycosyltransferase [Bosea sp. 685]|uniref:glycosyltransferase n=1 Tax=Bosea sp. 685 TaxID=3080057 RepID=UPI0028937D21|nr:glycosyltransferase [Bosea sp. 685]WNJ90048.1 glycosyltransferase [Bosea sp. 685]
MAYDSSISVSVVVPVYSGEAYLRDLIDELAKVRADWRERGAPMDLSEVILVDDSAIDGSPALLDNLAKEHNWLTVVHMMRNFGQHAATIAGVLHSSGDWVVTLDEDLQHPPAEIETLLRQAVIEGGDIVYARPASAVHEARMRDWASKGFKRLMVFLTGNANIVHFNSFRLIRGSLARAASSVCGYETYFDVALSWFTNRVQFRDLELKDRRFIGSGKSGYSFSRLLSHARRLLISSQVKIVRLFGLVGMAIVAASVIGAGALLVEKVVSPASIVVTGWTSLMLTIVFFGGFITFMIALALEYLSTLVLAAHGKPNFFAVDRSIDEPLARYFASDAA